MQSVTHVSCNQQMVQCRYKGIHFRYKGIYAMHPAFTLTAIELRQKLSSHEILAGHAKNAKSNHVHSHVRYVCHTLHGTFMNRVVKRLPRRRVYRLC